MNLAVWLATQKVPLTDFAARVKAPISTVHDWKSGRRTPRAASIAKIEVITEGAVTLADFIEPPDQEAAA